MEVHGFCDPKFDAVREAMVQNFEQHGDVGASVALTLEGEFVCDLWAGVTSEGGTDPWEEDTLVNVWSTTKTMAALCALVLSDRGLLDLQAPVAKYWPEFAQNGKEQVLVSHCLAHSAGLSGLDDIIPNETLYDWDAMCRLLAEQAPWWPPGTASGYHAITQGHLIGEVIRRITGRTLGQFFAQDIAEPLNADFHIGTPEHVFDRIATLSPPGAEGLPADLDEDSVAARTFRSPAPVAEAAMTKGWRTAEIPAANGHGNARSVVRAQTPVANGGKAFGVELLSPEGAARALELQIEGDDLVLGVPSRFGMGYGLSSPDFPMGPNPNTGFWGGWGGSTIVVDQDARLCCSYVMNKMQPGVLGDPRGFGILQAAYASL